MQAAAFLPAAQHAELVNLFLASFLVLLVTETDKQALAGADNHAQARKALLGSGLVDQRAAENWSGVGDVFVALPLSLLAAVEARSAAAAIWSSVSSPVPIEPAPSGAPSWPSIGPAEPAAPLSAPSGAPGVVLSPGAAAGAAPSPGMVGRPSAAVVVAVSPLP